MVAGSGTGVGTPVSASSGETAAKVRIPKHAINFIILIFASAIEIRA
jgi:hypothetical protein